VKRLLLALLLLLLLLTLSVGVVTAHGQVGDRVFAPEAYGALGDGIHDDAAAIQAAFDAADAANGGTVLFANGKTYLIASTAITMSPIRKHDWLGQTDPTALRSGTITLSGYGATVKFAGGSERSSFLFTGYRPVGDASWPTMTFGNVVVEGLTFDDNGREPSGACGSIFWARDACNVSNMTFKDLTQYGSARRVNMADRSTVCGIYMSVGPQSSQAHWNYCRDITVEGCHIKAQAKSFAAVDDSQTPSLDRPQMVLFDDIVVKDSSFDDQGFNGTCVHVGAYGGVGSVTIQDSSFTDSTDNLVEVAQPRRLTISGCSFSKAPTAITYSWYAYPDSATVPSITIDHCRYTGGANPYWPPDGTGSPTTCSVRFVDCYNVRKARSRTWGDIAITDCSVSQATYGRRFGSTLSLDVPWNSVRIEGCSFVDGRTLPGDVISVRHKGGNKATVRVADCSWDMSGSGSGVDLCHIYGNVKLDLDGLRCRTTVSGNYVNLPRGRITGTIAHVVALNKGSGIVAVRNSGARCAVMVRDCDFRALQVGTQAVVGPGLFQMDNRGPAAPGPSFAALMMGALPTLVGILLLLVLGLWLRRRAAAPIALL
jgi:hypothetical protein